MSLLSGSAKPPPTQRSPPLFRLAVKHYKQSPPTSPTRTKPTRPSFNGGRGSLKLLAQMPVDILYEIFGHLHPLDVLHLSRATKSLRAILLCRSANSVWKAAFANVQAFPPCPPDLTHPQYASLAFDMHCHFCLAPKVRDVYWVCRVRCCNKCISTRFISGSALKMKLSEELGTQQLDLDLQTIFPYIVYPKPRVSRQPGNMLYYLPTIEETFVELHEVKSCEQTMVQWTRQKAAEQFQRLSHAASCELWNIHWNYERPRDFNALIVALLFICLIFLWRDKL